MAPEQLKELNDRLAELETVAAVQIIRIQKLRELLNTYQNNCSTI